MAYSASGETAVAGGVVRWKVEADAHSYYEEMHKVKQSAKDTASSVNSIGEGFKKITFGALTAGATALTGAFSSLIKKGIQATDFLETSKNAMAGLTGSIQAGNRAMSIAANYWQNNPFQRVDVTNATKQLVQYGRQVGQLSNDLKILGNVALSTDSDIAEIAKYYGRVSASGRAMTQDLEMMSDRGIPIYRELAKQLGTTQQGVREFASQGKISFEIFQKAMEGAVDPAAMAEYGNTLSRQTDRMKGSIQILAGALAGYKIVNGELVISSNGLEKAWTRLVKVLATELRSEKMQAAMEKIGNALAKIIDKVAEIIPLVADKLSSVISFIGDHSSALIPILGSVLAVFGKLGAKIPIIGNLFSGLSDVVDDTKSGLIGFMTSMSSKLFSTSGILMKFIDMITLRKDSGLLAGLNGKITKLFENITGSSSLLTKISPIIAIVGLLGGAFVSAMKNSEEFRSAISDLFKALQKLATALMDALRPILQVIVQAFKSIVSSKAITGILTGVVNALTWLANALASIPTETLTFLISFFASFKLINSHPIILAASAIMLLIGAIQEMGGIGNFLGALWNNISSFAKGIATGISNIIKGFAIGFGNVVSFLSGIAGKFLTAGHNMMIGLANGVINGAKKVMTAIKQVATNILATFKGILQIHSPSRAMFWMGQFVTLGLAEGITDKESVLQLAMDNLAKDILSLSEKVIQNQKDFGIINYNGEYKQWQKVASMFTKGSEQYQTAMERMEEARKQVNLRIIDLQKNYNDTLDETISKIKTMYSTFQKVDLTGGMDATQIIKNMDQQVAQMAEWASSQEIIAGLELDPEFIKELQELGVDAVNELSAIANMTSSELSTLNELWLKKQEIANREATRQMQSLKEDTLKEIAELKDGIDGETVDVIEVGGRLVANIGEGVYGAIPTLEDTFGQLDDYMVRAAKQLAKDTSDTLNDNNDYGNDLLDVPNTASTLDEGFNELSASIEGMSGQIINALLGVVAAVAVFKFGPKLLGALFNKLPLSGGGGIFSTAWDKLVGWLGNKSTVGGELEKSVGKVAEEMKSTSKATETLATSSQQVGKSMKTASQGLTKAQSVMKTIMMGAAAVILIAGAIAAMAGALWVTYNALKGVDLVKLIEDLGVITLAVGAMGALAFAAGKLKISTKSILIIAGLAVDLGVMALAIRGAYELLKPIDWEDFGRVIGEVAIAIGTVGVLAGVVGFFDWAVGPGVFLIIGLAVDLGAMALAIRAAYEILKPVDWEDFGRVLGEVSATIAVMGVLAGVIGVFTPVVGPGVALIIGLAADIALIAEAIKHADDSLPNDFEKVREKIDFLEETIGVMGVLAGIIGVFAPLEAMGVAAVLALCEAVVKIASALEYVNTVVPNNFNSVRKKMQLVEEMIQFISNSNMGSLLNNIVASWNVGPLEQIIDGYVYIAKKLNILQGIKLDRNNITRNLTEVKRAIEAVQSKTDAISATLQAWADSANASSVESAGTVIRVYAEITENIGKLGNLRVPGNVNNAINTLTGVVNNVLNAIQSINTNGDLKKREEVVAVCQSIVNKFTELIPTLNQIVGLKLSQKEAESAVGSLKTIINKIGEINEKGDINNKEHIVAVSQSIINKFTEIIPTINDGIASKTLQYTEALAKIDNVTDLLYHIGRINEASGIENKEKIVSYTQSILNKFTEIIPTIQSGIVSQTLNHDSAVEKIDNVTDIIYHIGKINQASGITNKEWIVGVTQSILNKFTELIPVVNSIPRVEKDAVLDKIHAVQDIIYNIGLINQSDKDNLTTKEWIIGMATSMAYKLGEFTSALGSIGDADSGAVNKVINVMNNLFDSVSTSLSDKAVTFERVGAQIVERLAYGIESATPKVIEAGATLQSGFWGVIESKMDDEFKQGAWMAKQFANGLNSTQTEIAQAGQNAQNSYWQAIQNRMNDEYLQGKALGERFRQGLYDLDYTNAGWWASESFKRGAQNNDVYSAGYDRGYWFREAMYRLDYANAGWWAVQGFINGVYSRDVWSVGWNVASNFLNGMAARGRQGSPWKTTFQSGSWAVEGLIDGIKGSESALVSEATTLADGVISALSLDEVEMSPSLNVKGGTIAPSMDLSDSYGASGRRDVVIEQTNNNYTQYSLEAVNRDLAWELSKI